MGFVWHRSIEIFSPSKIPSVQSRNTETNPDKSTRGSLQFLSTIYVESLDPTSSYDSQEKATQSTLVYIISLYAC